MKTFTFERIAGSEMRVYLTEAAMASLGLPVAGSLVVTHGARRVRARVMAAANDGQMLQVTDGLAEALTLVTSLPYRISLVDGELRIGPVIGVLITAKTKQIRWEPGSRVCEWLLRYADIGGLIYLFALDGVDVETETISGFCWVPGAGEGPEQLGRHWERDLQFAKSVLERAKAEQGKLPPNRLAAKYREVRAQFMSDEQTEHGTLFGAPRPAPGAFVPGRFPFPAALWLQTEMPRRTAYERLWARVGPRIFNSSFFDKQEGNRLLSAFPEVQPFLPETVPFKNFDDLFYRLKRHQRVMLKQQQGEKGHGLIRLEVDGEGFVVRVNRAGKSEYYPTRPEVEGRLLPLLEGGAYLVQQHVDLPLYQGRPVDFRVMMQKDGRGQWVVRGMMGRFGKKGDILTSFVMHGYATPVAEALRRAYGVGWREAVRLQDRMLDMAFTVCHALDRTAGCYGDLGLDIGMDRNGWPWLFEANKMPFHGLPLYMGDGQMYLEAKSGPMLFASYLAGFPVNR